MTLFSALALSAPGADQDPVTNLADLSLEELSNIKITTASRRSESLADATAAVSVLTGDEIRRLGVNYLPDALRYVPGMDVTLINSGQSGIGSRGFAGQFANQLLVMIDGRSIYDPSFGAVWWIREDVLLADLDRIEVVRGPGGALWGANAMNGVINIVTKGAEQTQGSLLSVGGGTFDEFTASARVGFKASGKTYARVYAKSDRHGESELVPTPLYPGTTTPDSWDKTQAGFRLDHLPEDDTTFTLQGDICHVNQQFIYPYPTFTPPDYNSVEISNGEHSTANILGRWTRDLSTSRTAIVQGYFNASRQDSPTVDTRQRTIDLDLQYNLNLGSRHALTTGANGRLISSTVYPSRILDVADTDQADDALVSFFAQDEFAAIDDVLFLTAGAKAEHNDYTGWEFQPNLRLRWHPSGTQTAWAALSRAVATPGQLSTGVRLDLRVLPPGALGPGVPATLVQIQGGVDHSEELLAAEAGYRINAGARVSLDLAAFHNHYDHLQALGNGAPVPGTPPIVPVLWTNSTSGSTYGLEVALNVQLAASWLVQGAYSRFQSDVAPASVGRADGGGSPRDKVSLRSSVDLGKDWDWDAGLRHVSALKSVSVDAYTELDMRLAWRATDQLELELVGLNLLHHSHFEFPRGVSPIRSEVPRSIYGSATWHF